MFPRDEPSRSSRWIFERLLATAVRVAAQESGARNGERLRARIALDRACKNTSLPLRSLPNTTARPVMPSRPMSPTSTGFEAPLATTEAKPLSGKYTALIGLPRRSSTLHSGGSTGSSLSKAKSA